MDDTEEVTGYHFGTLYDVWLFKINDTGGFLWGHCYGGSNNDGGLAVVSTSDSGFIIAGITASTDGDVTFNHGGPSDYWVFKVNDTGKLIWQKTYGGSGDDESSSIAICRDGGYVITGYSNSTDGDITSYFGNEDMWTVGIDDTGMLKWARCDGGSLPDGGQQVQQTPDGGFLLIGFTASSDGEVTTYYGGIYDIWMVKLDSTGSIVWQKNFGGDSIDAGLAYTQNIDGTVTIVGSTRSLDHDVTQSLGSSDIWVANLDLSSIGIKQTAPLENTVVYPNPANNFFYLQIPVSTGEVTVTLMDVLGNIVPVKQQTGAINKYTFSASPGIYFISIISVKGVIYRKLVVD